MPGNLTQAGRQQILNLYKPGYQSSPQNVFSWSRVRLVYEDNTVTGTLDADWETTLSSGSGASKYATNATLVQFTGLDAGKKLKALQLVDESPSGQVVAEYVFAQPVTHSGSLAFDAGTLEIGFGADATNGGLVDTQTAASVDGYAGIRFETSPTIFDYYTDYGTDNLGVKIYVTANSQNHEILIASTEDAWTADAASGSLTAQIEWTNNLGAEAVLTGVRLYRQPSGFNTPTELHVVSVPGSVAIGIGAKLRLNVTVLVS